MKAIRFAAVVMSLGTCFAAHAAPTSAALPLSLPIALPTLPALPIRIPALPAVPLALPALPALPVPVPSTVTALPVISPVLGAVQPVLNSLALPTLPIALPALAP